MREGSSGVEYVFFCLVLLFSKCRGSCVSRTLGLLHDEPGADHRRTALVDGTALTFYPEVPFQLSASWACLLHGVCFPAGTASFGFLEARTYFVEKGNWCDIHKGINDSAEDAEDDDEEEEERASSAAVLLPADGLGIFPHRLLRNGSRVRVRARTEPAAFSMDALHALDSFAPDDDPQSETTTTSTKATMRSPPHLMAHVEYELLVDGVPAPEELLSLVSVACSFHGDMEWTIFDGEVNVDLYWRLYPSVGASINASANNNEHYRGEGGGGGGGGAAAAAKAAGRKSAPLLWWGDAGPRGRWAMSVQLFTHGGFPLSPVLRVVHDATGPPHHHRETAKTEAKGPMAASDRLSLSAAAWYAVFPVQLAARRSLLSELRSVDLGAAGNLDNVDAESENEEKPATDVRDAGGRAPIVPPAALPLPAAPSAAPAPLPPAAAVGESRTQWLSFSEMLPAGLTQQHLELSAMLHLAKVSGRTLVVPRLHANVGAPPSQPTAAAPSSLPAVEASGAHKSQQQSLQQPPQQLFVPFEEVYDLAKLSRETGVGLIVAPTQSRTENGNDYPLPPPAAAAAAAATNGSGTTIGRSRSDLAPGLTLPALSRVAALTHYTRVLLRRGDDDHSDENDHSDDNAASNRSGGDAADTQSAEWVHLCRPPEDSRDAFKGTWFNPHADRAALVPYRLALMRSLADPLDRLVRTAKDAFRRHLHHARRRGDGGGGGRGNDNDLDDPKERLRNNDDENDDDDYDYGDRSGRAMVVHLRFEADWIRHCGRLEARLWGLVPVCADAAEVSAAVLAEARAMRRPLLFVVGDPGARERLEAAALNDQRRRRGRRRDGGNSSSSRSSFRSPVSGILHADALLGGAAWRSSLSHLQQAAVELAIASEIDAGAVTGSTFSTFFGTLCLHAASHNPPTAAAAAAAMASAKDPARSGEGRVAYAYDHFTDESWQARSPDNSKGSLAGRLPLRLRVRSDGGALIEPSEAVALRARWARAKEKEEGEVPRSRAATEATRGVIRGRSALPEFSIPVDLSFPSVAPEAGEPLLTQKRWWYRETEATASLSSTAAADAFLRSKPDALSLLCGAREDQTEAGSGRSREEPRSSEEDLTTCAGAVQLVQTLGQRISQIRERRVAAQRETQRLVRDGPSVADSESEESCHEKAAAGELEGAAEGSAGSSGGEGGSSCRLPHRSHELLQRLRARRILKCSHAYEITSAIPFAARDRDDGWRGDHRQGNDEEEEEEEREGDVHERYDGSLRSVYSKADLPMLVRDLGYDGVGAELGVLRGDFSLQLLRHTRLSTLLLVDVWAPLPGDPSWRVAIGERDDDDDSQVYSPLQVHEANQDELRRRIADVGGAAWLERTVLLRNLTSLAAAYVADESLDFVYVDAAHDYGAMKEDLQLWWPKIRPGGLMSGNDYFTGFVPAAQLFFGVKDAVDEFFAAVPARVYATVSYDPASDIAPDWYVLKC